MRNALTIVTMALVCGCASSTDNLPQRTDMSGMDMSGELRVQIHTPSSDEFVSTGGETVVDVEGVASTIGGVRFLDMVFVLDTSNSLERADPNDYRTAGAAGLVESLSSKSDTQIGVIGFDRDSEVVQELTSDRRAVVRALGNMKRSGGTDIASGIHAALDEFTANGRPESSRVIMLFTDGQSNRRKALEAARKAQLLGVRVQSLLLGKNRKGAAVLEDIALVTGGGFVQVTDPSELPEAFLNLRTTGVDSVVLSVNGAPAMPAQLVGGTFTASVPLGVGENRIVATATSLGEQTKESVVTVNVRDASCAALEVAAVNDGRPALSLNDRSVEIVVDASRSMWGRMDGQPKMSIAKEILQDASDWLPEDVNLALRAYGNNSPSDDNDCTDSALLVPFGDENREPIRAAISVLSPLGQTPIAYALNQAADDFSTLQGERALVLVTDGIESCGGDPVQVARELRKQDIMIHLIGFGLGNAADEDTASLQAVADASGGRFLTASSASELKDALAVTVGTRFQVFSAGTVVATGALGSDEPMYLPQGDYTVRLDSVPPHEVDVTLAPRDEVTLTLQKQAGAVSHSEQRERLDYTSCDDAIAAVEHPRGAFESPPEEHNPAPENL